MAREEIVIESWRFTTLSAFIRELEHLLSFSDYRIEAHVRGEEIERLMLELEAWRGFLRLKVKVRNEQVPQQTS
jgi:hypothetical protein